VLRYVRLDGGLSRGAVIMPLTDEIAKRHKVGRADVMFRFWCDSYQSSGGSPAVYTWDADKMDAVLL
jgi:hypothetical protein